ncbi:RIP homotypic interaction motif-containing protein [Micromonospora wenchangensis]|uniref:RIP homotypic interaction motif-containing protein n=1 Tax=Micromonospora wenchangensis TaxID=1185415 RepID=UPI0034458EB2
MSTEDVRPAIVISNSQGVQIGDHNVQNNLFAGRDPVKEVADAARELALRLRRLWSQELQMRGVGDRLDVRVTLDEGSSRRTVPLAGWLGEFAAGKHHRLVISGAPGSGKSTAAAQVMLTLLDRDPEARGPVPVLCDVSGWDPHKQHLDSWLATWLAVNHPALARGGRRRRFRRRREGTLAERLVQAERILPIIDGLNELPSAIWPAVRSALDRSFGDGRKGFVIVCTTEALPAVVPASLPGSVTAVIEPLTADATLGYLGDRWAPVAQRLRAKPESALAGLATPLMTGLAAEIYATPGTDPAELLDRRRFPDSEAVEDFLLTRYVSSVYRHTAPRPDWDETRSLPRSDIGEEQARRWLGYLARRLDRTGRNSLTWWELSWTAIRPARLRTRLPRIPRPNSLRAALRACGDLLRIVGGIAFLALAGWGTGRMLSWANSLMEQLLAAPSISAEDRWWLMRVGSTSRLIEPWTSVGLGTWFTRSVVFVSVLLALEIVYIGLEVSDDDAAASPREQLRQDRRLALVRATLVMLGVTTVGLLTTHYSDRLSRTVPAVLLGAAAVLLGAAAAFSSAWGRHQVFVTWQAALRRLPFRTVDFLHDAYQRGILRRSGSRYQFRHLLLQHQLAGRVRRAAVAAAVAQAQDLAGRGRYRAARRKAKPVWLRSPQARLLLARMSDEQAQAASRRSVLHLPIWWYHEQAAIRWWVRAADYDDPGWREGLGALYLREAIDEHGWRLAGRLKCSLFYSRALDLAAISEERTLFVLDAVLAPPGSGGSRNALIRRAATNYRISILRPAARSDRRARRRLIELLSSSGNETEARDWALTWVPDGPVAIDPSVLPTDMIHLRRIGASGLLGFVRWMEAPDLADLLAASASVPVLDLSATVQVALATASAECGPSDPLHTGHVLDALARHDPLGAWERIWEHTGYPAENGLRNKLDDDATVIPQGANGITSRPITAGFALALRILDRLVRTYGMVPLQPGGLAIALAGAPESGAAEALLSRSDLSHQALIELMATELMHADLPDLYETISKVV